MINVYGHWGLIELRLFIARENRAGRPVFESNSWHYNVQEMRDYQNTFLRTNWTFGNPQDFGRAHVQEVPHDYWDDALHEAFFGRTEDGLTAETVFGSLERAGVSVTYLSADSEDMAEEVDLSSISQSLRTIALQDPGRLTRAQLEQILTVLSGVSLPERWTHDPKQALRWALRKSYAEKRLAQLARADAEEDETYFINWSTFLKDPYLCLWDVTQTDQVSGQVDDATMTRVFNDAFDNFIAHTNPQNRDDIRAFKQLMSWAPSYQRARWFFLSKLTELMNDAQREEDLFERMRAIMVDHGTTCRDAAAVGLEKLYGLWLSRHLRHVDAAYAEKAHLSVALVFFKRALLKMYQGQQRQGENIEAALNLDRLVHSVIGLGLSVRAQAFYRGEFGSLHLEETVENLLGTNLKDIVDSLVYQTVWASYLEKVLEEDSDLRALQEKSAEAPPEFWETEAGQRLQVRLADIPRIKTLEALKRHGYLVNTPLYPLELLDMTRDIPT